MTNTRRSGSVGVKADMTADGVAERLQNKQGRRGATDVETVVQQIILSQSVENTHPKAHGLLSAADHTNVGDYLDQPVKQTSNVKFVDVKTKSPIVDVRAFGAVGDNVADDTQAFQDAIDYAAGGTVLIPAGNYRITSTLTLTADGSRLMGVGREKSVIYAKMTGTNCIETAEGIRGCVIEGLKIRGYSTMANGIHLNSAFGHVQLKDLHIVYCGGHGIDGSEGNAVDLYMSNIRSELNVGNGFNLAPEVSSWNTLFAHNCYAQANGGVGWEVATSDTTLVACMSDNNTGNGFNVKRKATLIGCSVETNTGNGFRVVADGLSNVTGGIVTLIGCIATLNSGSYVVGGSAVCMFIGCTTKSASGAVLTLTSNATGKTVLICSANLAGSQSIAGGITKPVVLDYVQQAHIVDADGTLADITTKFNTLLASLETIGLLATS